MAARNRLSVTGLEQPVTFTAQSTRFIKSIECALIPNTGIPNPKEKSLPLLQQRQKRISSNRRLSAVAKIEPLQNISDIILPITLRNKKIASNLSVTRPLSNQPQNFPLSRRQIRPSGRQRSRFAPVSNRHLCQNFLQ